MFEIKIITARISFNFLWPQNAKHFDKGDNKTNMSKIKYKWMHIVCLFVRDKITTLDVVNNDENANIY